MQPNAIQAALTLSILADTDHLLYDVHEDPEMMAVFAASDNVLFSVSSPTAAQEAAAVLGTREIWIAPIPADGTALAGSFILLGRLRAGDTGPTPEAVTEDTTYDNGTVVSNQTGVNNGSKTWDIEGSADDPAIDMLINHARTFGTPEKKGKAFAYIAFNEDRSSFSGTAKVNTASSPREGAHRWAFGVSFEVVDLRRPAQNPLAGTAGIPAAADVAPDSAAAGATVTITGVNLNVVASVRVGTASITVFSTQTTGTLAFALPTGTAALPLGPKTVTMVYNVDDEVYAGDITIV